MDADLSGKLNEILSDPDRLKTVMAAVSGIMGQNEKPPPEIPVQKAEPPPLSASVPAFKSNERTELLRALKPFLSKEKSCHPGIPLSLTEISKKSPTI